MCYRLKCTSVNDDNDWRQRVAKEDRRLEKPGALPDPFAHSLSTVLSSESKPPAER